ncbi:MAG: MFS transporter [Emcibacter sp.]|nr:MFS transporter [Emcibacter sp.]
MTTNNNMSGYKNPIAYKIGGAYTGMFFYVGIATPFWALWLATVGITPSEIGFLLGFPAFLKLLTSPFIAQLCDKLGMKRKPMLVLIALAIFFFCGYLVFSTFYMFAAVAILFSIAYTGFAPLMETYTVRACEKYNLQYGRMRSIGSAVFILGSVFMGKYLDYYGYDYFLYFCLGSFALIFISVFFLPKEENKKKDKVITQNDGISPLKFLLTNKQFVMFLVVLSLIFMSHGFLQAMGSYYWASNGIDNATVGALWSTGVIAEILVFLFAGKFIALFRPMHVLAFIAVFGAIRWSVLAISLSLPLLFMVQTIHGLTFGAAHLVSMYFLSTRVPDKYFTTAQSLYSSVPMGFSIGMVMLLAGPLYNRFGGHAYFFMAGLCLIVLFMVRSVRRIDVDDSILQ